MADSTSFFISKIIIFYEKADISPPAVPTNLHQISVSGSTTTVSWNPPAPINGIKIAKYIVSCNNQSYETTNTYYTVSGLEGCTSYTIGVKAKDECDNISSQTSINVKTMPEYVNAIVQSPITLSTYPNNRYIIEASNSITLKPGFSVKANNSSEFFQAVIGCSDLFPHKRASELYLVEEDDIYNELYPVEEEGIYKTPLSVLPSKTDNDIRIYPNPTSSTIIIEYPQFTGDEKMILFDITGKPLLETKLSGMSSNINISFLSSGIYFIKVITQNSIFVQKLVKM
jgi:hypothetical protein